jgi:hypothetical protein
MDEEMKKRVREIADKENRGLAGQVREFIAEALEHRDQSDAVRRRPLMSVKRDQKKERAS